MSLDLKVIGAGLGRTGTTSLKTALETLLEGPCFHFLEYKSRPELMTPWLSLIEANPLRSDPDKFEDVPISQWERVMPGYVACVDEPASYYWKQLSDAFPKALVILVCSGYRLVVGLRGHDREALRRGMEEARAHQR